MHLDSVSPFFSPFGVDSRRTAPCCEIQQAGRCFSLADQKNRSRSVCALPRDVATVCTA